MTASIPLVRSIFILLLVTSLTGADTAAEPPSPPEAAYIHVHGDIDPLQAAYFDRALDQAISLGVRTIVTHIDSPGGRLDSAEQMVRSALEQRGPEAPRMVAFVDSRAISAAAALAYAHDEIHLTSGSNIGDIGVIFMKPDGTIEYAPEKIEAFVRALLATAAEVRGWNQAVLVKMTARNQSLYEVRLVDGGRDFVLSDDLPRYLADHPEIDHEDAAQVFVIAGEDRLLTLSPQRALELGMATAIVDGLHASYRRLGIDPAKVVDLSPTRTELVARTLAPFASLLAGLALLFAILELKTPGVGIWALLALIAGAGFFICQFYAEMASHLEVTLIVLGIALLVVELFTAVGGGAIGLGGGVLVLSGLVLAFMPDDLQFAPGDADWAGALGDALLRSLFSAAVLVVGAALLINVLPHSRLLRRIAVLHELRGSSAGEIERDAAALIGRVARARSPLHPSGIVVIDGEERSASSEHGVFIAAESPVEIIGARFGELIVRAHEADGAQEQT